MRVVQGPATPYTNQLTLEIPYTCKAHAIAQVYVQPAINMTFLRLENLLFSSPFGTTGTEKQAQVLEALAPRQRAFVLAFLQMSLRQASIKAPAAATQWRCHLT